MPEAAAHIEVYERQDNGANAGLPERFRAEPRFDWRLVAANNEIVCSSLQGFNSRGDATRAAERAVDLMLLAPEMRQV